MAEHTQNCGHMALFGGSFNPPHIGHFRMVIAMHEVLCPSKTLFIPCATPPHKTSRNLLPFALRAELVTETLQELNALYGGGSPSPFATMELCTIENERSGPSYTIDTLSALSAKYPDKRLAFVLGSEDYQMLATWRQWEKLPDLADLVILPRGGKEENIFVETTHTLWPDAVAMTPPQTGVQAAFRLANGGRLFFIPQLRLDISSSDVRDRWLAGRSLDFLVPQSVQSILRKETATVTACWENAS